MELTISQEKLDFALANVSRIASTRSSLPILGNILLRTDGTKLVVASTNLEVAAIHQVGAKIVKPGSITVPARLISEFVHNLPKESITLSEKNHQLHISSGGYSSTINGTIDEEFPELPITDPKTAVSYNITTSDLKSAVNQTIVAASTDSTRPILTGVYWHSFDGYLYSAATDGYRLAEKRIVKTSSDIEATIPTTPLQEVLRTLKDDTEEVQILFTDTQVTFQFDTIEITSRLIDGKFPDYRQLIPVKSDSLFSVQSNEFIRITKIAGLFARESGGGITISADTDKKQISVHSVASEVGENTSEVEVDVNGESGSVSLNSRYLSDALSVIEGDMVTFEFSGKLAPCILTSAVKNPDYKHIIMPLKS